VVRYGGPFVRDKKIICNARDTELSTTLKELAGKFVKLTDVPKDPVQKLSDFVGSDNEKLD